MATVTVTIAGVDRTSSLCQPGAGQALEWGEALRERPTISCSFVRRTGSWKPQRGQHITMVHSTESDLFGGYITEVSRRKVAGNTAVFFDVTAVAYEQILSRRYAAVGTYIDQTAGAIFEDVMNNSLDGEGFTVSIEEAGPVIPRFEIQSPRPKVVEAAEAICERASSGGDVYYYKITTAKVIRFFKQDTTPAPFSITDAHPYVLGTEGEFATVSESNEGKVNRVFEYMGQYLRPLATESFPGDSATRTFELAYPCGAAPVLVVNETEVGDFLGIDGIDTGKQWYWSLGSKTIRQDDLGTLLTPSDTLYVTYTGQDRLEAGPFEDAADASAEGVLQGDGTGIYETMLTIETPQTLGDAATHAAAYLARYKRATVTFRGATYTAGLRAGQELTVNLTDLDINLSMLVQSVTMRDMGAGHFLWSFTAIYGAARDDWKRALLGLGASGVVGGSGAGGGAESGGGGAITPLAPNLVSVAVTPIYGLLSAASAFGFTGAMRLADDYTHLQSIQPIITLLDGSSENLCPRILTSSGVYTSGGHPYLDFTSEIKYLQDTLTLQSYSIAFVCYDENGVATDSPLTESVSVQIAKINSITSPREVLSGGNPVLSVDPVTRLLSSKIGGIPVFNGNQVPQYVTYWISENNGTTYLWLGWDRINVVGTEITFYRVKPTTSRSEKIAMCQGAHGGDPTVLISAAALPTGAIVSSTFSVSGLALPSASNVGSVTVASGGGGSWPYNKLTPDGSQYFSIPTFAYDESTARVDPNTFFLRLTAQDYDASGNAIGPEQPFAGDAVQVNESTRTWGPLEGDYGSNGFGYTRLSTYPTGSPTNIAKVRLRVYAINRARQDAYSFTDSSASVLQTGVGGGAGYVDVTVASGGTLPAGKVLGTRFDPDSLGNHFGHDPATGKPGVLNNNYGASLLADPTFAYSTPGTVGASGLAYGWNTAISGGSIEYRDDGGNSDLKYARLTDADSALSQTVSVQPGLPFFFQVAVRSSNTAGVGHGVGLYVDWLDANHAPLSPATTNIGTVGGYVSSWTNPGVSGYVTSPAGAAYAILRVQTSASEPAGGYWDVDDVYFQPVIQQTAGGVGGDTASTVQAVVSGGKVAFRANGPRYEAEYGQDYLSILDNLAAELAILGPNNVTLAYDGGTAGLVFIQLGSDDAQNLISLSVDDAGGPFLGVVIGGVGYAGYTGSLAAAIAGGKQVKCGLIVG